MDWKAISILQAMEEQGCTFVEADCKGTDEEGVTSYTVYIQEPDETEN
jgi:hypothetical protein